jgi:DNA-binding response OmpR family regulator
MKKLLIIDDDVKLLELLKEYFEKNNFECDTAELPSEGMKKIGKNSYDLIILDVMLPEMDGFEVCKQIRKQNNVPILMLTAKGETTDRVVGLEIGADDYVSKPFEPRELLARINAIIRRNERSYRTDEVIEFKDLKIDCNKREVIFKNQPLELTSTEYELLLLFVKNNGKVLSRDYMLQNTRGISWQSYDRSIDVLVSRLRTKLSGDSKEEYIKTIHSVGYMFYIDEK